MKIIHPVFEVVEGPEHEIVGMPPQQAGGPFPVKHRLTQLHAGEDLQPSGVALPHLEGLAVGTLAALVVPVRQKTGHFHMVGDGQGGQTQT